MDLKLLWQFVPILLYQVDTYFTHKVWSKKKRLELMISSLISAQFWIPKLTKKPKLISIKIHPIFFLDQTILALLHIYQLLHFYLLCEHFFCCFKKIIALLKKAKKNFFDCYQKIVQLKNHFLLLYLICMHKWKVERFVSNFFLHCVEEKKNFKKM